MVSPVRVQAKSLRAAKLLAGTPVLLSGVIYTARDAAHRKLRACLESGQPLPFPLENAVIYYAGPTPAPPGRVIGSCGPTTSSRMDPFVPQLMAGGLCGMIGKGERDGAVCDAIRRFGGVYLCAVGGAGALLSLCVREVTEVAFPELGCESVKALTVEDMPLMTAIDAFGGNLFARG